MKRLHILANERAFVHKDGLPVLYLEPGKHFLWDLFGNLEVHTYDTNAVVAPLTAEQISIAPENDVDVVQVGELERAFVYYRNDVRYVLGPGSHAVWTTDRVTTAKGRKRAQAVRTRVVRAQGAAALTAGELAHVAPSDLALVEVGELERAVVHQFGRPTRWLDAGSHQVWTVERTATAERASWVPVTRVDVFDVSGVATKPLAARVAAVASSADYVEVTVPHGHAAVRFVDGRLDEVLSSGRHAAWRVERSVTFQTVDLAEQILQITGQEVMTKDRLSLRLALSAVWKVGDVARNCTVARSPSDLVYRAVQLAAREAVATRTLDELLADRDALGAELAPRVAERAEAVGLELVELGVKDIVLPGELKALLNKVIEAKKQAEANVILRREETSATRSLAQTAKVLEDNPVLLRLKELEAYKDLAAQVGNVDLVVGGAEGLQALKLR